jgi:threonine 3-dehydrogenase
VIVRAIVKTQPEPGSKYQDFELPEMGPRDVLVKVRACAICGTDVHIYNWNEWAARNFIKSYGELPRILGHEFAGEIIEVGSEVSKVKKGDRIAAETHISCGQCFLCRTGKQYNCQNMKRFKTGVFAEYAVIPEFSAEKIPESIPYHVAALFEPFGVAVHAASYARMVGDTVAVIGSGPIGLFSIVLAKSMGATTIIATDVSDFRLSLAEKLGADYLLNPTKVDIVPRVKEITGGLGTGIVFETSGDVRAMKQGFEILRKCGTYLMVGLPSDPLTLDAGADIAWKGAVVFGVYGRDTFTTWEIAKNLLSTNTVDIEPLITHQMPFSEFEDAFNLCNRQQTGKVILYPD